MKITALVENQSTCELNAKHGLSLYIETAVATSFCPMASTKSNIRDSAVLVVTVFISFSVMAPSQYDINFNSSI